MRKIAPAAPTPAITRLSRPSPAVAAAFRFFFRFFFFGASSAEPRPAAALRRERTGSPSSIGSPSSPAERSRSSGLARATGRVATATLACRVLAGPTEGCSMKPRAISALAIFSLRARASGSLFTSRLFLLVLPSALRSITAT